MNLQSHKEPDNLIKPIAAASAIAARNVNVRSIVKAIVINIISIIALIGTSG
jgi:hypothetical protein